MRHSRRNFLRGAAAGAAVLTLPFLRSMKARGATGEFPKRLIVMFSANGTIHENWAPTGTETDFQLSTILSPLADFKDKLLILDGVDMASTASGPGDGHQKGMGHMLTATDLMPGPFEGGGNSGTAGWAGGISIDQKIAQHLGVESLDLGVQVNGKNVWTRMSYDGADKPRDPRVDPYGVYDDIFGNLTADPAELAKQRALRKSAIDFVKDDIAKLEARMPAADKPKLEAHLDAVRSVEKKLDPKGQLGGYCAPVTLGDKIDPTAAKNYPMVGELMMDLLVMAMACRYQKLLPAGFRLHRPQTGRGKLFVATLEDDGLTAGRPHGRTVPVGPAVSIGKQALFTALDLNRSQLIAGVGGRFIRDLTAIRRP